LNLVILQHVLNRHFTYLSNFTPGFLQFFKNIFHLHFFNYHQLTTLSIMDKYFRATRPFLFFNHFYAPETEDWGGILFLSCLSFRHSVWNFNLANNFWMVHTRALIFDMSVIYGKTFPWASNFLTMWPWPWCLTYLWKTLTLVITFKWYVLGCWYFTWVFHVWQDLLMGTTIFDLVTLTLMFDLLIKNFNLVYNFWMVCTRALIYDMSVPYCKTIPWVPNFLTMWPWP
jgi:hypothetical protein